MVFCPFRKIMVILPGLGHFCAISTFSARSYFHTWSLLPHHIKSPKLQQFLPVKVQTRLYCYIKSRWWHERDNREHLPMWSSSCQHPQPQSLGHDKENHLKNWKALLYPLLKRRTGPHEEESDPLSVLKSIPRMATAMQSAMNLLVCLRKLTICCFAGSCCPKSAAWIRESYVFYMTALP